jgi:uncharacterized protein (DUF58 family)
MIDATLKVRSAGDRVSRRLRLPVLGRTLTRRAERWARRRQGTDAASVRLRSRRIYILPTGVGVVFALTTFAMLLGSMNYNNNLSFLLTFLLTGLGFVAMHQCQRNLVDLEVSFAGVDPVFAGQAAGFRIAVTNHSKHRRHNIRLFAGSVQSGVHDLKPGESRVLTLRMPTERRGYRSLERYGIHTLFPFELFRAWAWLHMDLNVLVYPRPAEHAPLPLPTESAVGHRQYDARGEEDFSGFRQFHDGDSPRHVAWKAYARSGELLSKQFSGGDISSRWFDFDQIEAKDTETRLSILARWIIDAEQSQRNFGLRLPGSDIPPSHGEAHRHRCLEALATFGDMRHVAEA